MFASPWRALFLGFVLLLLCIMFSAVTGQWLMSLFGGGAATFNELARTQPGFTRFLQGLSNLLSWGLPALFWAVYTGGFRRRLGFTTRPRGIFFGLAALTIVIALPFVESLLIQEESLHVTEGLEGFEEWAKDREVDTGKVILTLLKDTSFVGLFANVMVFAVIPAVSEELFFRGFLLGTLKRSVGLHAAVWISATIFSIVHFQVLGLFSRIVLGAMLGYFYAYSGNLWASIVAHFTHNLVNIVLAVLALRGILPGDVTVGSFDFGIVVVILSFFFTTLLVYYFSRKAHRFNSTLKYE